MKKRNAFIIGAAALVFLAAGCMRSDVVNLDSDGNNIICFGDSLTRGKGAGEGKDYPAVLSKMTHYHVINAGINSDTSGEALKRVKNDVLDRDPLIVIVEFGGNDFLSKTPLEVTSRNIEQIVQELQKKGVMAAIADISTGMFMEEYGPELKRLSRKYGCIFIPHLLDGIITNPGLKSDPIHPNAKGYSIIAHRVYRGILPYLNQNSILRKSKKERAGKEQGTAAGGSESGAGGGS